MYIQLPPLKLYQLKESIVLESSSFNTYNSHSITQLVTNIAFSILILNS